MRRAFIALGIAVFLVYCWASVVYQNRVPVPGYRLVDVDLLGGRSRADWDADTQARFQRLMELENGNYQLPADAAVKAPPPGDPAGAHIRAGEDGMLSVDEPLGSDAFAWIIKNAPADGPVRVRLRDTSAIYDLLGRNYSLRDTIDNPDNPEGEPLYVGGRPLDKAMLDDLRAKGFKSVTVTGHGSPVTFQLGTALMVAVIFLTLVAALRPVLWAPFMALLEKRRRELEAGGEAERENQVEATRFQDESRRRHAELNRTIQELRLRGQRETAGDAAAILQEARTKEKAVKLSGLQEIGSQAARAEEELEKRIPELAEAIARSLTPGAGKPAAPAAPGNQDDG